MAIKMRNYGNISFGLILMFLTILLVLVIINDQGFFYQSQVILDIKPNPGNLSDNSSQSLNQKVYLENDSIFGEVYYFNGGEFLKKNEEIRTSKNEGFSVSAFAFVNDSSLRNNLGIVSTNFQTNEKGFRMKYRNFEDEDRLYVQIGDDLVYAPIKKGECFQKWCHYSFNYNPLKGELKIFINGEKSSVFQVEKNVILDNKINIGNTIDINYEYFKGKIAKVKIYSGILSDREIKDISSPINIF